MLNVRQLIHHLSTLDPELPVGVIDIDRNSTSQRASIGLHVLVDLDTVHDPQSGEPLAVWLTAQTLDDNETLRRLQPATVVLPRHPCGCLIPVTLTSARSINLDAFACPHHQPNDLVVRSAIQPRP